MSRDHLKRTPHKISELQWWYEEPLGISVVAELRDSENNYLSTTQTKIKWSALRAALKRLDKKK
jgi:hypothetical protein